MNLDLKSKAFFISLITLLVSVSLFMYGLYIVRSFSTIEDLWVEHHKESAVYTKNLDRIRKHLGYGGFIHNFKNYVIRKDKKLIPVIETKGKEVVKAIQDYKKLDLLEQQKSAILNIERVFKEYIKKFELAKELFAKGASISDIDEQVKVDDKPAIDAIEYLTKAAILLDMDKEKETKRLLNNTTKNAYWGLLFIIMFIISGFIVVFYMKKLFNSNIRINEISSELNQLIASAPDALFLVSSDGLIIQSNIQASKMFKYTEEELCGLSVDALVPERFRQNHINHRTDYVKHPHFRLAGEKDGLIAIDKNNKEFPIEIALNSIQRQGETVVITEIRDISKRQQYEKQLRLHNRILDEMAEGVNLVDDKGIIVYTNPRFNAMFGYEDGELIGQSVTILNAKADQGQAEKIAKIIIGTVSDKGYWTGEVHNVKKNGEEFWSWASVSRMTNSEFGDVLVTVQQDISNEKNVVSLNKKLDKLVLGRTNELLESRKMLEHVINTIPVRVFWKDLNLNYLGCNKLFAQDAGLNNQSDILGKNDFDMTWSNEAKLYRADDKEVLHSGKGKFNFEEPQTTPAGERIWLETSKIPLTDADDNIIGILGTYQDITPRKQAEEALKKSEHTLQTINDSVPALIAFVDSALIYQYVNQSFENWFGLSRESIVGSKVKDVFGENVIDELTGCIEKVLAGERQTKEKKLDFKFGPARYVNLTYIPSFDNKGSVIGFYVVINDITKQHEEQKIRIEQERKQKDTLVREVHHRIKNNLQSVVGLLRRESSKHKELEPYLNEAIGQVNMISIVHGIQGFSEAKLITLPTLLDNIVLSIEDVTQVNIGPVKYVDVKSEFFILEEEAVPIALIINELITNAVKYKKKDELNKTISITFSQEDKNIVLQIENSGTKLPEDLNFENNKGLGMGLKLVKSLLPKQGADLSISESEKGVLVELVLKEPVLYVNTI